MKIRGAYGQKDVQSSPQTLGERLRRIRVAWGWSQGRFAAALGCNQRLVSHWERGKVQPSGAALTAISALIGLSAESLVSGKGFTIPDLPSSQEGMDSDAAARFTALTRSLPQSVEGKVSMVDLNSMKVNAVTQAEAIRVLKDAQKDREEIWLVVRSRPGIAGK